MVDSETKQRIRRAAFHEAGHVVVASIQGMAIKGFGMCICDRGMGYSAVTVRPPDMLPEFPICRNDTIFVLHAGAIAEKCFDSASSGRSACDDLVWIRKLLAEDQSLDAADLETVSRGLVKNNWTVIDQLATDLLKQKTQPRPGCGQNCSESKVAQCLSSQEIKVLLGNFGIEVKLCGPID